MSASSMRASGLGVRRHLKLKRIAGLLLVLASCSQSGMAQTAAGGVSGTILDATGAAVPDAVLELQNNSTSLSRSTTSNQSGRYTFLNLPPGRYVLSSEKQGFKKSVTAPFDVSVNTIVTEDISLSLGATSQTLQVNAEAEMVQRATSQLGTVIAERPVHELPLNGRNFTQLLTLTPGATPVSTSQSSGVGVSDLASAGVPGSSASNPSIHGQWNRSSLYLEDGIINTNFRASTYAVMPIVDTIQEFIVQSHNDKAEFGSVLGGVVNVVSKSGGNELHGSAWEFVRNDVFDARNPFTDALRSAPAPFRQNQFGASLGGPVVIPKLYDGRNRTFFFFGYEGWRYRRPQQSLYRVPTNAELSGDFASSNLGRVIYDPLTTRRDPNNPSQFIRDRFAGNVIPQSRISPAMSAYFQSYYDRSNYSGDAFYNAILSRSQSNDANNYQVRLDHHLSDKDTLWGRFSPLDNSDTSPITQKSGSLNDLAARNIGGGWTHIFTPNLVLDARVGYAAKNFNYVGTLAAGLAPMQQAGFTGIDTYGPVSIGLQSPFGSPGVRSPQFSNNANYSYSANLSWLRGNHNIKTGFQFLTQRWNQSGSAQSYSFNDEQTGDPLALATTGSSLASALLGLPTRGNFTFQNSIDYTFPALGFFVQDEWKVRRNLTVNVGLRYDYLMQARLRSGMNNGFNLSTGEWLIGGGKLPPPCNTSRIAPCIPGDGTLASIPFGDRIRVDPNPVRGPNPVRDNFGPRLGISWQPSNGTVVRAGYSLVYDTLTGINQTFSNSLNVWPSNGGTSPQFNQTGAPLVSISQAQNMAGSPLPSDSPWETITWYFDPNRKNAYSHQWNAEIQRQVGRNLLLSVGYVGSSTRRLDLTGLANISTQPGPGTPDQVNARKPFPYMASTFYQTDRGRGNYHGFEARAERRFTAGFNFLVSYTWSKSIDNGSSGWFNAENGPGGSSGLQNFYDPKSSRSVSSYNVPHFLSISGLWELPFGRAKRYLNRGPLSWVLGDWQINGIVQVRSGQPYNLTVIGDPANIGSNTSGWAYARPNLVGNPTPAQQNARLWFDPNAFAVPVLSYGNFGRNVLRTQRVSNADVSLFKTIPWKETRRLEIRFEGFNVFNQMNLGVPNTTIGQPSTGRITSLAVMPRQIQLGARLVF